MDEARTHYAEALKDYRQLADRNPDTYLPDVATTLNNLGMLDGKQDRKEMQIVHWTEALSVYKSFSASHGGIYSNKISELESNIKAASN